MTAGNAASSQRVHCDEPQPYTVTPTPAPPTTNVELLQNGNFSQGYAPWVRSDTAASLVGGKLDFYKSGGAHVLYQNTPIDLPQYAGLQLVMEASNTSNVRRRMTVILNPVNWSDFRYCNFWLPANTTTQVFLMRTYTLTAWTDVNVSIYDSYGTSGTASIRIDNVRLRNGGIPTTSWTDCETNPPYCPAGFVEDVRSGCTSLVYSLQDYGVDLIDSPITPNDDWSAIERAEVLQGVQLIARALWLTLNQSPHADPVEQSDIERQLFREVMQGWNPAREAYRRIPIERGSVGGVYCRTSPLDGAGIYHPERPASIACDPGVVMTQYTAVHELGHVFSTRSITAYRNFIDVPPLLDALDRFLMGSRSYNLTEGNRFDWQRSDVQIDSGWGSAALWDGSYLGPYTLTTPPPLYIPNIGPCGEGVPSQPTVSGAPFDFQQNPCTYPSWLLAMTPEGKGNITELEEAAADMFLNWVYSINGSGGFSNYQWRATRSATPCYPNGCPNPIGLPGDARRTRMGQIMGTLVPTMRATQP